MLPLLVLGLMMTSSMASQKTDEKCKDLIPGAEKFYYGVDITKLDPFPVVHPKDNGVRDRILGKMCPGSPWKGSLSGKHYRHPYQSRGAAYGSSPWYGFRGILKTVQDLKKLMADDLGLTDEFRPFASVFSASYKDLAKRIAKPTTQFVDTRYSYTHIDIGVLRPDRALISKEAASFIKTNLTKPFKDNKVPYLNFVKRFGTHYINSGGLGGTIRSFIELDTKYNCTQQIKEQANATLAETIGHNPAVEILTSFQEGVSQKVLVHGGKNPYWCQAKIEEWVASIEPYPILMPQKMSPLYKLFKDKQISDGIKKASMAYVRIPH